MKGYIFGGVLFILVGFLAFYFLVLKKPKTTKTPEDETPEDEEEKTQSYIGNLNTGSNINTGSSNVNTGSNINTGSSNVNTGTGGLTIGATNNAQTGGTSNPNTPNTPTTNYKVYDPKSQDGKGVINTRISLIKTNPNIMDAIKISQKIGKTLFDGVSNSDFNDSGINKSAQYHVYGFLQALNPAFARVWDGADDQNKYATYPIYSTYEKPSLADEMMGVANDTYVTDDHTGWLKFNATQGFRDWGIGSLGGQSVFNYFGNDDRKRKYYSVQNGKVFYKNYVNEIKRMDEAVYLAAVNSLKNDDNIVFTGINA